MSRLSATAVKQLIQWCEEKATGLGVRVSISIVKGGIPLFDSGHVIGGLGIAGGTAVEDLEIAEWALAQLSDGLAAG